jgi:hypothetical protein
MILDREQFESKFRAVLHLCGATCQSKFRAVPHLFVFAFCFACQNLLRASFALTDKNEFRVFSYGTCWGFRSPIPRSTLRLSPRFLPAAVTVFDLPIKKEMLDQP